MSSRRSSIRLLLLLALCFLPTSLTRAQSMTATLSGTVTDPRGALVRGAAVTVTNPATRLQRQATTNDQGSFTVPLLPPSTYTVSVESQGFAPVEVQNVVLNANDVRSLKIELKVGQVGESVIVTDEPALLDENPTVMTTIDRQFVSNLPLNGRSLQTLIALSPGVVAVPTSSGSQGQFSVNGQRANSNYFTVDGVSGNFSVTNFESMGQNASGSIPTTNIAGGFSNLASVDALQEFSIQTSTFAAEFGRSPGAQVSLVTRSGENAYHGLLFEYVRNDLFDARDVFDTVKPKLRLNNFGGTFGGPVILPRFGEGGPSFWKGKDKTFFFFSYEGQRFVLPQPAVSTTVPSLTSRNNAPNDVARAILNAYPVPNGPDIRNTAGALTGGAIYTTTFSNPNNSDALSLRIDQHIGNSSTLFGRFSHAPSNGMVRDRGNPSSFTVNEQNTLAFTLGSTQVFGAKAVNEVRANYSHQEGFAEFGYDGYGGGVLPPESIIFPASVGNLQRRFSINGITNVASGTLVIGDVVKNEQRQFQLVDNFSYQWGNHQLKFGGDHRLLLPITAPNDLVASLVSMNLTSVYNNVVPLVLAARSVRFVSEFKTYSFYGQDTWKVSKKLTLTYGVRWEINPAPTGRDEGKKPLTFATAPDLTQLDQSGLSLAPFGTPYYKTEFTNFGPRFGASYRVSDKPGRELVVRGGIGIFHDLGQVGFGNVAGFPYTLNRLLLSQPLPLPDSAVTFPPVNFTPSPSNRGSITVADPGYTLPRTYQWNLTAEQSLGRNQTLSVAYVGALGRKLVRSRQIIFASSSATPNVFFSPNFSATTYIDNASESSYHSLQSQFTRRLSRGIQTIASYTWSHSIDNGSNDSGLTSPGFVFPQSVYRGNSDFDVRHNFSSAVVYNIPVPTFNRFSDAVLRGWSLTSIFSARTGLPFNVTVSETSAVNTSVSFRRPNATGAPFYIDDPTVATGKRLNPAAFDFNVPAGQMGSLGRNVLRGPGFWQVDLGLHRTFGITERVNLQLRAEAFNVFNHPNFLFPSNTSATRTAAGVVTVPSNFGTFTQSAGRSFGGGGNSGGFNPLFQNGGPRSMQFAFRLTF